jgi:GLPGLI family protein
MKIKLTLVLFFLITRTIAQVVEKDSYRITYILDFKTDSTNLNDLKQEVFYLYISGKNSKFIAKNKIEKDSILARLSESNLVMGFSMMNRPKPKNEYIIYNINGARKYIEMIGLNNFGYSIEDVPNWVLKDNKEKFESFDCNIAIANNYLGRNWKAFYDPKYNIATGPYKFFNLPGLIVKVFDEKKHYVFTLQKIEKINHYEIEMAEKYALLKNRQQLLKLKRENLDDPFRNLPQGMGKFEIDPRQVKEAVERRKRLNNNPLELE